MKKTIIYSAAAAALMLSACNREESGSIAGATPKEITVEAQIGNMTRATTTGNVTSFDKGDIFSLYAWTDTPNAMPQTLVVNGVKNTLGDNDKWTPETPMLWADMVTPHYFLGVYPAHQVADFTADAFTLGDNYEQNDLLAAVALTGQKAADSEIVSLTFDHVMAKFYVNMNFRNQWEGTPDIATCTAVAASTCTVNYLAKSVTVGVQSTVTLAKQAQPSAAHFAATCSGIMIPQTGFRTVKITIDGKDYTYTHSEDIPLAAGKFTNLNLVVCRDKIELGEISVTEWAQGETIDGGQAL